MSVWFVIPSKRGHEQLDACLGAWLDMGYCVALAREPDDGWPFGFPDSRMRMYPVHGYQGWARSVNILVQVVAAECSDAEWFVTGGDDYYPDPTKRADEIAAECEAYFHERYARPAEVFKEAGLSTAGLAAAWPDTFGVMQPTGDRWCEGRCTTCHGSGQVYGRIVYATPVDLPTKCEDCNGTGRSAVIDRICGSPWMGREFCRRMYHGAGPLYNGYYHNFADQELQEVSRKLSVLWQRRDLIQTHQHWATKQPKSETHTGLAGDVRNMPEWAAKINDPKLSDWERSKALFAKRKAAGFPGHEPLEI